jgi:hypothetical protein
LNRRLGGLQNWPENYREKKNFIHLLKIELRPPSPWPIAVTTELKTDKEIIQVSKMKS